MMAGLLQPPNNTVGQLSHYHTILMKHCSLVLCFRLEEIKKTRIDHLASYVSYRYTVLLLHNMIFIFKFKLEYQKVNDMS